MPCSALYAGFVIVFAILLSVSTLATAASKGQKTDRNEEMSMILDKVEASLEMVARMEAAMEEGDDDELMALVGTKLPVSLHVLNSLSERIDPMVFYEAFAGAMHRRYNAVFTPPENIEDLCNTENACRKMKRRSWSEMGTSFSFNGDGVGSRSESEGSAGKTAFYASKERERVYVHLTVPPEPHAMSADLDLDGEPDLVYDGKEARIEGDFALAFDEGPEGRRQQWLLASQGANPREKAQFMLYRDGDFFLWLFDSDGDGFGNCGRSTTLGRL